MLSTRVQSSRPANGVSRDPSWTGRQAGRVISSRIQTLRVELIQAEALDKSLVIWLYESHVPHDLMLLQIEDFIGRDDRLQGIVAFVTKLVLVQIFSVQRPQTAHRSFSTTLKLCASMTVSAKRL